MSQPSFTFNKPVPWYLTSGVYQNLAPPGQPIMMGIKEGTSQGVDVVPDWYKVAMGFSVKTPKPWPNGNPALKQWNPFQYSKTKWITHEASFSAVRTSLPPFPGQSRYTYGAGSFSRVFSGVALPTEVPEPNVQLASQKLLAKIKAMDWNAGEMLGEVAQTAGLFVNTLNRIANAILAVKQGKTAKAMKILNVAAKRKLTPAQRRLIARKLRTRRERQIASEWLAINYGVLPLIDDVQAAVKHLQNRSDWSMYATAGATETPSYRRRGNCSTTQGVGYAQYASLVTWTTKARYVVQFVASNPTIAYFRSLGLTNLPSLMWELHPGSLLVDWALPIGSWLSNMDATFGCTFQRGVLVQKKSADVQVTAWLSSVENQDVNGRGIMRYTSEVYSRSVITTFPTNSFPQFKNPVSIRHSANALAFLVQAVHR